MITNVIMNTLEYQHSDPDRNLRNYPGQIKIQQAETTHS